MGRGFASRNDPKMLRGEKKELVKKDQVFAACVFLSLLDPNYWADPHDREMSIRGLKLAQEIMKQDALKPFVKREVLPGPDVTTDEDYIKFACANSKTDHHPAGTCRI